MLRHALQKAASRNAFLVCHGHCSYRCSRRVLAVQAFHEGTQQAAFATKQQELLGRRSGMAAMAPGQPLQQWSYEVGPLAPDQVDIRVTHNGLCHTDIHMKDNDWGASAFPFIPGHEVVGVVAGVGASVKGLAPGDRVGVGWIADSCRVCPSCLRGEENLCAKGYTGLNVMGAHGGFQNVMRCVADFAYKLPDALSSEDAAPLLCAGITVYAPLKRALIARRPGMHVGVVGIGGLGHLAVQFAAAMGATVTALGSSPSKAAEAARLGAKEYLTLPQAAEHTTRYDAIINTAPGSVPTAQLMSLLANDGSLYQVGIPGGRAQIQVDLQDLVFCQKKLEGSIVGGRRDMMEMLEFAAAKGIKPMVETMPLSSVNEAMQKVLENKVRYRVVLLSEESTPA